ncbi:MAG TPA: protein kinase [Verrucomicrobiae bacterium]|nr:protein kinase [Verrucomicrobiae bacterium]
MPCQGARQGNRNMIGQFVGHYRVLEKIGSGGMGEVFRARDERLGRDVALKLIRPASSENPEHLRRFEQEARAAAALNHPNILAIYDVGFAGTSPYIVSELLLGKTLRARMTKDVISVRDAAQYAIQIAQGLVAAHERHIVHRDLKPENIFLTDDGRVKILDFGVAKLQPTGEDNRPVESLTTVTKSGTVVGTVAYMSPEQLRGKPVDHRSDIFSFGSILYEMLAGCRAFTGETEVDTITAVLREEPADTKLDEAAVPLSYREILKHCLEKEPQERFQSAKDLVFALQTISGSSPDTSYRKRRKVVSLRALPWSVAAILAAVAVWIFVSRPSPTIPVYRRLTFESGTIYSARFAPDGQSIVYSAAWNNRPMQTFSTVGNSLLAQPLNLGDASVLALSPTNELAIVLHGKPSGQLEITDGVLATAPMAGGAPREMLADVRWADWDGNGKLAVVREANGHCRLEYPVGNVLYQTGGWISHIRFSPQHDRIAFLDHPALWDNRGSVAVVDLAGHVRTLTREWESEQGIAWRPDGKEIWFSGVEKGNNLNLMAVDPAAGKLRLLLDLPVGIMLEDIASDGRVLVTLNSKRLAMAGSTLGSKEDVELSWHDWNSARDISPDGQYVLFEDASEAAGPRYAVAIRKLDGSLPTRLGEGSAGGLSPDGKWAISISVSRPPQVTLLPIGTGQPRTINIVGIDKVHNGWAHFLPNGQAFYVIGDQKGHGSRCYLVDPSNGNAKPITPEGVTCGVASPDSRWMIGFESNHSYTLYSMTGEAPRQLLTLNPAFIPVQWSSDERHFFGYHLGELPSKIYKVEIATGKETFVQELKPSVSSGVVLLAPVVVSRDGKRFAYSYNQTLSSLYLISGLK